VVFGAPKMELRGRCVFTLHVRGENLPPISDGMRVTLVAHDKQTGQWAFNRETRIYGVHLQPDAYAPVALTLDVPLAPETYGPELILQWAPESEGVAPVLFLDKAEIATQEFSSPVVTGVSPSKVRYKPLETAAVEVALANPAAEAVEATLVGEESLGLDTRREVSRQAVTLGAGEQKALTMTWQLGPQEYGRELRARLLVGGREVDAASELFGVSKLPLWACAANGYDHSYYSGDQHSMFYVSPASGQDSMRAVRFWRKLRKCYWEFFSWAPGDISDLAPTEDPFAGGEGRLTYRSRETLRQQTAMIKSAGMWPVSYVNGTCWAESGYQLFARHPEWFLYDANGEVAVYDMANRERYRHRDDADFDPNTYNSIFFQAVLNHSLPEVQQYIARQFIRCGKEMGFAGVRLDVRYIEVYPGERDWEGKEIASTFPEADRISAAAVKNVKALVHRELSGEDLAVPPLAAIPAPHGLLGRPDPQVGRGLQPLRLPALRRQVRGGQHLLGDLPPHQWRPRLHGLVPQQPLALRRPWRLRHPLQRVPVRHQPGVAPRGEGRGERQRPRRALVAGHSLQEALHRGQAPTRGAPHQPAQVPRGRGELALGDQRAGAGH